MSAHIRWEQKASQRRDEERRRERPRPKSCRGRYLASVCFYAGAVMESALPPFNLSLPVTCRLKFGLINPALVHINKLELKIKK
jgi:hypothetical protein